MSEGKLEKLDKTFGSIKSGIVGLLSIVFIIVVVIAVINVINNNSQDNGSKMSITEAQEKCMLMEEADMVNYMGEPFGAETTKKAEKHCLSLWDRSENPDNTDEKFIEIISTDWETRKTEVLEGYTLEALYNEAH